MSMLVNSFRFGSGIPADNFTEYCSVMLEAFAPIDESSFANNLRLTGGDAPLDDTQVRIYRDTANKKFGASSFKFESVEGATILTDKTNLLAGSSSFTVEFFIRAEVEPASARLIGIAGSGTVTSYYFSYDATTNAFNFITRTAAAVSSTATFDLDTDGIGLAKMWDGNFHHIAAVRNGTTVTVYVDGLPGAVTSAVGTDALNNPNNTFGIGSAEGGTGQLDPADVNLDEVRVTIGVARYTSTFTPPSVAFGRNSTDDPSFASVALLMGMNSFFGLKKGGAAKESLRFSQWDDASFIGKYGIKRFTSGAGSNSAPYFPYNPEFNFLAGDFTVELFGLYADTTGFSGTQHLLGCWHNAAGNRSWRVVFVGGVFAFQYSTDGTNVAATVNFTGSVAANTAHNLTVVRSGSVLYLYKDGVLSTTASMAGVTIFDQSAIRLPLSILAGVNPAGDNGSEGANRDDHYLKALRVSKGVARFLGSTYAVPALPLPVPGPVLDVAAQNITMNDTTTPPAGSAINFIMGP